MLAFDIFLDGTRLARAGFEDWGVLAAHLTAVRGRDGAGGDLEELRFAVGGLSQSGADGIAHHVRWGERDLRVGSHIAIEVIETDTPDVPLRRYRSDKEVQESSYSKEEIEQFEREEFERLKAKFEPGDDGR